MAGSNKKRKKRRNTANTGAALLLVLVVCIAGLIGYRIHSLSEKRDELYAQQTKLESEVAAEEARSEELEESKDYVQTRDYIEKMARERLGLVGEDEIIVKPGN